MRSKREQANIIKRIVQREIVNHAAERMGMPSPTFSIDVRPEIRDDAPPVTMTTGARRRPRKDPLA